MNNAVNINAGSAVVNIMANSDALNKALDKATTKLQGFANVAGIIANKLQAAGTLMFAPFQEAARIFADFDARMRMDFDFGNPNTLADGNTLARLSTDMVLLADVLYAALLPDLTTKNIPKDDFCDAICGDTLNAATYALLEAVSDFFPKAQGNLLKKVLQSAKTEQEKMAKQAMEELEKALTQSSSQTNSQESAE